MEKPLNQLADLERRINNITTSLLPFDNEQFQITAIEHGLADQIDGIRHWKPKIDQCQLERIQIYENLTRIQGLSTVDTVWARGTGNAIEGRFNAVSNMYNYMSARLNPVIKAVRDWEDYHLKGPEGAMIAQMLRESSRR